MNTAHPVLPGEKAQIEPFYSWQHSSIKRTSMYKNCLNEKKILTSKFCA